MGDLSPDVDDGLLDQTFRTYYTSTKNAKVSACIRSQPELASSTQAHTACLPVGSEACLVHARRVLHSFQLLLCIHAQQCKPCILFQRKRTSCAEGPASEQPAHCCRALQRAASTEHQDTPLSFTALPHAFFVGHVGPQHTAQQGLRVCALCAGGEQARHWCSRLHLQPAVRFVDTCCAK